MRESGNPLLMVEVDIALLPHCFNEIDPQALLNEVRCDIGYLELVDPELIHSKDEEFRANLLK